MIYAWYFLSKTESKFDKDGVASCGAHAPDAGAGRGIGGLRALARADRKEVLSSVNAPAAAVLVMSATWDRSRALMAVHIGFLSGGPFPLIVQPTSTAVHSPPVPFGRVCVGWPVCAFRSLDQRTAPKPARVPAHSNGAQGEEIDSACGVNRWFR